MVGTADAKLPRRKESRSQDKVCRDTLTILTSEGGRTRGLEDGGADGGADGVDEHFGGEGGRMSGESK